MYRAHEIRKLILNGKKIYLFRLISVFGLLFFIIDSTVYAQTPALPLKPHSEEYVFNEIKLPGDEPIRDILAVLQDNRGFVWMAGNHGLMRYDGHDFKIFRNIPGDTTSIIDTDLLSLYLLDDTTMCIGGKHGISIMDIRTEKVTNLSNDQDGNPVEWVSNFYSDKDGAIWIAALNGLYSLKPDLSSIINHYLNTPPITKGNPTFAKRVYCITQHSIDKNLLMLGTECGLISFDKKRNAIHKIYPNTEATFWRSHPPVYKFIEEGDYLWCKCWISGIPRFDMVTETWKNFCYPKTNDRLETVTNVWSVNDLMFKNKDEIWVCDWDRGLYVFNKNSEKSYPLKQGQTYNVLDKPYMKIYKLKDGALWLSCDDGLWRQNLRAKKFEALDIPFSHTWVSATLHDEETDEYYFGLSWESYGVACWNCSSRKWAYYQPETDKKEMFNTFDIFKDSYGVIWIATSQRGLWYIDKKSKTLKPFKSFNKDNNLWNSTFYKIFEDSKNNLWLGTGKYGVVRLNSNRTKADYFINDAKDSTSLRGNTRFGAIEEDQYGRIWIGSYNGFCTFDPKTETFSREIPLKLQKIGIRDGYTYSIVRDTTNAMWLTIEGQGLIKIEEQIKDNFNFIIYQTDNGLKDLTVRYMTSDKQGGLWLVNNGLLYLNPYNNSFMLTDERSGLLENIGGDDKIMVDKYGNVFCGEQVGLNWLGEAKKYSQSSVSNLIIENIDINSQSVLDWNPYNETKTSRIVKHNQNNFTFGYTAICFEDYNQVRYRYKLEGLEDDWNSPTNILETRYTNLKPGKYRFVVDVSYKGVWLGYNKSVEFRVKQAFWRTWWFVSLSAITILTIFYLLYLNRKRHKEKQLKIRLKIASDLHDDVGSTLSSISIMSDILQTQLGNSPNVEEMIREIGSNAHNMLESMDDIIWSVIPVNDSFENLVARIQEYAIPLFESKDICFKITAPNSIYSLSIPIEIRHDLFLIAKEAINNLVKHSDCSEANIEFSVSHAVLKMAVSDNGKGFDISRNHCRNGLKNMEYRAERIGGKLTIHSEISKGTMIKLIVRVG
jgi:signal transduction histidine kinase/ligand-binding sensor domain-containing protein